MNTAHRYERHGPAHEPTRDGGASSAGHSPFSLHGDPSRSQQQTEPRPTRSVQWVRLSELPAVVGSKYVRLGIDANSDVAKATRRAPRTAISRIRNRVSRRGIATPPQIPTHTTSTTREGIGL